MNISTATDRQSQTLDIKLLAVDLDTCTRCVGSLTNIQQAIELLQEILAATGVSVSVSQILIESEEQARQHQFVTSPTIRINDADIALETLESHCDSCTDLAGCDRGVACRVWHYRGEEYTEAPVGAIVDAILGAIYRERDALTSPSTYTGVSDNLKPFFNSKVASASACCSAAAQATCCEAHEKADCCGTERVETGTCGCQ